jgi:hypothetical protein
MSVSGCDTPQPLNPRASYPVPIVQETGRFPVPVWKGAENLVPPEFDPRTVEPVTSRYTDWVIQRHVSYRDQLQIKKGAWNMSLTGTGREFFVTVTHTGVGENVVRFPARARVEISSGVHPASHTMGTATYFRGDKAVEAWSWTLNM